MMTDNEQSEAIIKAISNEIRRNIIRLLVGKMVTYTELAHLLNFNLSKQSGKFNYHLQELVSTGIISKTEGDEYYLTDKGEEIYYLLMDIERDREIDPHGVLTALVRMGPSDELFLFLSGIGIFLSVFLAIVSIPGIIMGFSYDEPIMLTLGFGYLLVSAVVGWQSIGYYHREISTLLGSKPRTSQLISALFFLGTNWYFVRSKNRIRYMIAGFFSMFGMTLITIAGLVQTAVFTGIESNVGDEIMIVGIIGAFAVVIAIFLLFPLKKGSNSIQ